VIPVAHVGGPVFEPLQVAILTLVATAYAFRLMTLSQEGRPVPGWRVACFVSGLALIAIAFISPLGRVDDQLVFVHMIQHLLMGDLGALLIVLGLTGPLLAPLLRIRAVSRLRALSHPVAAVVLWAASLYLWHLRPAYEAAVAHGLVHVLQHACFFVFGANLWLALLGPLPKPDWFGNGARLAYVLVVFVAGTMLAYGFIWSATPFYPHYAATAVAGGRSAVADQSAAGAIMLVEQTVVIFGLFAWLLARALRDAGRRQELAELATAHGVALDERRIARAVAADRADVLARRLREEAQA
jgi:putative membrane protein